MMRRFVSGALALAVGVTAVKLGVLTHVKKRVDLARPCRGGSEADEDGEHEAAAAPSGEPEEQTAGHEGDV